MQGYFSLILYCLITAVSALTIHSVTQKNDPTVVMVYTFLICIFFFNLINLRYIKQIYQVVRVEWKNVLSINLLTLITWICTFWGLKYLTPELFVIISMGTTPIIASIMTAFQSKKLYLRSVLFCLVIALLIISIIILHLQIMPATKFYMGGIIFAILMGASLCFYLHSSEALYKRSALTPSKILSIRFYLLTLVGIFLMIYPFNIDKYYLGIDFVNILIISMVSIILPLYFLQVGINKIGALKASYIIPLTPIFTYLLALVYIIPFNLMLFALIILLSLVLSLSAKLR